MMKEKIAKIQQEVLGFQITDQVNLEQFRIHFLGSKGEIKSLFGDLKSKTTRQKNCGKFLKRK